MRSVFGKLLRSTGYIILVGFGLLGFGLCIDIVIKAAGFWGLVLGILLLPVMCIAAPWYAVFAWGDWLPLVVCYSSLIVGSILVNVGQAIAGDELI